MVLTASVVGPPVSTDGLMSLDDKIFIRMFIWVFELAMEVVLLASFYLFYFGIVKESKHEHENVGLLLAGIIFIFVLYTGYFFTTALLRLVWRSRQLWHFSCVSSL